MAAAAPPQSKAAGPKPDLNGGSSGNARLDALISANPTSKYIMQKTLGQGSFGVTMKCQKSGTPDDKKEFYAAKIIDTASMSQKDRGFVANEVRCLARCNHPNIIAHHLSEEFDGTIVIIMEYADGGDLYKQIKVRQTGNKYFKEHEVLFILVQLCLALHHVHSKKMMHRDLKTANVLLTSSGIVKIGDFGFSRQYEDSLSKDVGTTFCGTPYYLSPELWKREPYSKKSEMWALGVVLYEIMSLKRPFRAATMKELMNNIVTATYEPLPEGIFSKELCDVVHSLLSLNPEKRPSLRELFQNKHIREAGLIKLKESVDKHVRIPPETQRALLTSIENALNSSAADDSIEVRPLKGTLEVHTAEKSWVPCELDLQLTQLVVTVANSAPEAFPVSTLTSACPVQESIAGAPNVFAIKSRLNNRSYWLREKSPEKVTEWVNAITAAMGF